MSRQQNDRNLLIGIVAYQMDFISRDQLVEAMGKWVLDKQRPIDKILVDEQAIDTETQNLLLALVEKHLALHQDDPHKSLAAISSIESDLKDQLQSLDDHDVDVGLTTLGQNKAASSNRDASETTIAFGQPSRSGRDRFQILRPHARGGLGKISVALDTELNREVALKEIQESYADNVESRARFTVEAEITGNLEHPGIIPVYGLGNYQNGRPFYAMRLIKGASLKEAADAFHRGHSAGSAPSFHGVEFRKLLSRLVDVCHAVAYAHSRGVLHRDLKPNNIMLGKYGETLVVDWGLSKVLGRSDVEDSMNEPTLKPSSGSGSAPTQMGAALGTPQYMSPEQAAGRIDDLGPASDVYSLGATMYYLLTGRPPFNRDNVEGLLRAVERGDFPAPREVNSAIPKPLDAICRKAMAREPQQRYANANRLVEDLECWLADEPVSAKRESLVQRGSRWLRKHRWAALGSALMLVVISVTSIVAAVWIDGARRAKHQALLTAKSAFARANEQISAYPEFVSDYVELNGDNPALSGLRTELQDLALQYYEQFIEMYGNDRDLAFEVAEAYDRLGTLKAERGNKEGAIKDLRESVNRWTLLVDSGIEENRAHYGLAWAHKSLGIHLQALGNSKEAQHEFARAVELLEELKAIDPDFHEAIDSLANLQISMANDHTQNGEFDTAKQLYDHSRSNYLILVEKWPDKPDYLAGLSRLSSNLGVWYAQQDRRDEAKKEFESAVERLENLIQACPGNSQYRSDLGALRMNLARLNRELSNVDDARELNRKAVEELEALVADYPGMLRFRSALTHATSNYGNFLRDIGEFDEAIEKYEAALASCERLRQAQPQVPDHVGILARLHSNLGRLHERENRLDDALNCYLKSRDLRQDLVNRFPNVKDFRNGLGLSENGLGSAYAKLKRVEEADACYRRAIENFDVLIEENSDVAQFHEGKGWSLYKRGWLYYSLDRFEEAQPHLELAASHWRNLVQDHADVLEFKNVLGGTLNDLALVHLGQDRLEQARALLNEAIEHQQVAFQKNPEYIRYREYLSEHYRGMAETLGRLGQPEQSAEFVRKRVELWPENATMLHDSACCLVKYCVSAAKEAQQPGLEAEAVDLLQQAIAAGLDDVSSLTDDDRLEPIRERQDFRDLVRQLENAASQQE